MGMAEWRGRVGTLLAVLAVLLGLLGMHALASAHHAAAAPADRAAQPAAGPAPTRAGLPEHHGGIAAETEPVLQQHAAALAATSGQSCDGGCASLVAICVAVLTGAALALLLARRRARPAVAAPPRPPVRALAPPAWHARGPDPVRELCVSRT